MAALLGAMLSIPAAACCKGSAHEWRGCSFPGGVPSSLAGSATPLWGHCCQWPQPQFLPPGFAPAFLGGMRTAASRSAVQPSFPQPDLELRLAPDAQALQVPWLGASSSPEEKGIPHGRLLSSAWGVRMRAEGTDVHCAPWVCSWPGLMPALPPASSTGSWLLLQLPLSFGKVFAPFLLLLYLATLRERKNCGVWRTNKWTPPREMRGEQVCPWNCLPNSAECGETNGIPLATTMG